MSWRVPLLILLALVVAAAGYIYLPYIGWSLLEPSGRDEYASEDAYRRLMAEADWSRFKWEFGDSAPCDDGICTLTLRLSGGRESAPEVAWSDGPGDPGVLVSLEDRPGDVDGFIEVRQRGWFGGIGVDVFGVVSH